MVRKKGAAPFVLSVRELLSGRYQPVTSSREAPASVADNDRAYRTAISDLKSMRSSIENSSGKWAIRSREGKE